MKKKNRNLLWESRFEIIDKIQKRMLVKKLEKIERTILRPLHQEIVRCIFFIVIIFLDIFVLLQILIDIDKPFSFILFFIVLFLSISLEIKLYYLIWGDKGYWVVKKGSSQKKFGNT